MSTISRIPDGTNLNDEVERVFRQVFGDSRGPSTAGAWSPLLDVEEDEDRFTLHVELPGIDPDEVEVSLEENVLTIKPRRIQVTTG
jgi:HSP20 family protein